MRFDVVRVQALVVTLLGPDGNPVPAGSRAEIAGTTQTVIVGFDGEAYLEDAAEAAVFELQLRDVRCRYRIAAGQREQTPAATKLTIPCEVVRS